MTATLMKFCRKCGENTERHSTSKRCLQCKSRLDAAAWERKKAALNADPEQREAYRVAVRERMRRFHQRQAEAYDDMPLSEQSVFLRENEPPKRRRAIHLWREGRE